MTALANTPGNRIIAAFFWVLLRVAAIALAALSVWATTTGVYAKLGGTEEAKIFSWAAGAMNVFAIFLFFRGTVLWKQARRFGAAICFTVASLIVAAAVIYDRTGIQVILERNNLVASASEAESNNRDELIAAATARVERAAADSAAALRGKEIAQEALDRESATGFGDRSQAAADALREANATLSSARADLRAAEEALATARAIPVESGVSLGDAADAADTGELALGAILWGLSALLEIVSALAPSLLGLRISDRVDRGGDGLSDEERAVLSGLPDHMRGGFRDMLAMQRAARALANLQDQPRHAAPPPARLVPAPPPPQSEPIEPSPKPDKAGRDLLAGMRAVRSVHADKRRRIESENDSQNQNTLRARGNESEAPVVNLNERRDDMRKSRSIPPHVQAAGELFDKLSNVVGASALETWVNQAGPGRVIGLRDSLKNLPAGGIEKARLPADLLEIEKQSQKGAGDGNA